MKAEELWEEFCSKKGINIDTPYEAWAFGGKEDEQNHIARLVIEGKKFGTTSLYDVYEVENILDEIPKIGDLLVIL